MSLNAFDDFDPEVQEYLAHHGIKGQKWGIRRYQNEDGSLTALGKIRYGIKGKREGKTETTKILIKQRESKSSSKNQNEKKKRLKEVSTEDLQKIVNRLKLEQEYKNLVKPKSEGSTLAKAGKRFIEGLLASSGKAIADGFVKEYSAAVGKALGKNLLEEDDRDKKKKQLN